MEINQREKSLIKGVGVIDAIKKNAYLASLITITFLVSGFCAIGVEYSLGAANDDWWTAYPDQSSGAGGEVKHPAWVLDALEKKPVVIYVHKGCSYCKPQTEAMAKIVAEMGDKFTYYDIPGDGTDDRSGEILQAYDPNGGVMYVPLTVVVTLAPNSEGKVVPVWHSTDEVTGEDWIRNYVENAISQYDENSGSRTT